jgi:hypothetical protein
VPLGQGANRGGGIVEKALLHAPKCTKN